MDPSKRLGAIFKTLRTDRARRRSGSTNLSLLALPLGGRARSGGGLLLLGAAAILVALVLGVAAPAALAAAPPSVVTDPASEIGVTTVKLSGAVNPQGAAGEPSTTTYRIQYSLAGTAHGVGGDEAWSTPTEATIESEEANPHAVEAIFGFSGELTPGETYEFRIQAEDGAGSAETAAPYPTFTMHAAVPPVLATEPATAIGATSATLHGTIDPGGGNVNPIGGALPIFWRFEYREAGQTGWITTPFEEISGAEAEASTAIPIGAETVGEVLPHKIYEYRLTARYLNSTREESAPEPPTLLETFTTEPAAPKVDATSAAEVTSTSATLQGQVDPNGAPTTIHFEYVTESQFEASGFDGATVTPESQSIGQDDVDHAVTEPILGLQPGTAYRFRLIATNPKAPSGVSGVERGLHTPAMSTTEAEGCANAQIRAEQHSTFLPDCRAYEMVSPPEKLGGNVLVDTSQVRAAADGSAAEFTSLQAFGDAEGTALTTEYLSQRGPGGWSTHSIAPPGQQPATPFEAGTSIGRYVGEFSPDLSKGLFVSKTPLTQSANEATGVKNLYLRTDLLAPGPGSYQLISKAATLQEPDSTFNRRIPTEAGHSADFSHVLFESRRDLTEDAVDAGLDEGEPKLYEWVNGGVRLVGQVPASGTQCVGAACEPSISIAGQGALEGYVPDHAISADGSRVFFTAPGGAPCESEHLLGNPCGRLYVRDDHGTPSTADDTTTQINVSEKTNGAGAGGQDPTGAHGAIFQAASADGSRVFFTTQEQLTNDDDNPSANQQGWDLYMWSATPDAQGHHLTLLSVDNEPADGERNTLGVLGVSEDGSYVYFFVARGNQLVAGGPLGCQSDDPAEPACGGIYVWHEGTVRDVGDVNDYEEERMLGNVFGAHAGPRIARVTPDGARLLFETHGTNRLLSLYGRPEYDHGTNCAEPDSSAGLGHPCSEIYLYEADATNAHSPVVGDGLLRCASCNASGQAATGAATIVPTSAVGAAEPIDHLNRTISDDGRYVFFSSAERLVPEDTNGVSDAYEYDTTTGQIHLLSSGTSPRPSYFLEAGADGRDAFIATTQQLVGTDTDQSTDLYDARVEGGFPEPPKPAGCGGENCQGSAAPPPAAQGPSSSSFQGPGNPKAPACPKAKVAKHGKCVKKHAKKHAKKHDKKGHGKPRRTNSPRGGQK